MTLPVVLPEKMAELERAAFAKGADPAWCMEMVASHIAAFIARDGHKRVRVLVGTGNNGGDGARLGALLLERGIDVELFYVEGKGSELREKHLADFPGTKGPLALFPKREGDLIIDALFGTGFKGPLPEEIAQLIEQINCEKRTVYSIDIPSGLDGASGKPLPVAFFARITFFCALPKEGFFLGPGFAYVGHLIHVPIGIDFSVEAPWRLLGLDDLHPPSINRLRYKFESGVVSGCIASSAMAGAGILSAKAAFRAGSGYVRLAFTHEGKSAESLAPLESVKYSCSDLNEVLAVLNNADAAWIGPGLPETQVGRELTEAFLKNIATPSVIDGGALFHLSKMDSYELPENAVLTPHRGEMHRLAPLMGGKADMETCQRFADQHGVTLVLKGAPTWIFHPGAPALISPFGDPGMATAGSGDVLTGVIAAQLAAGTPPREAALFGVALHGISGYLAARELSSYSLIARDIIDYLPKAFQQVSA